MSPDFEVERLATYLQTNKLPMNQIVRHGEFGEIVGALFRRVKGYSIPNIENCGTCWPQPDNDAS